ncbi:MAG: hypothetical protein ACXVWF_06950 [Actinomycetota bacterium]
MAARSLDDDPRESREGSSPLPGEEPEPEWAGQIRSIRRARGDRLKEVFASFDDEEER